MNGKPKCTVTYEGPLFLTKQRSLDNSYENNDNSDNDGRKTSLGRMIRQALLNEWNENKKDASKSIDLNIKVDWTHAGDSEDAILMREEIQQENSRQSQRMHDQKKPIHTFTPTKIEPFEVTQPILTPGYYRLCVRADLHALIVELDLRSSLRLGGVDSGTGHVFTYDTRDLLKEESDIDNNNDGDGDRGSIDKSLDSNTYQSELEELSKILINQVQDADLTRTKDQVKELNVKASEIMTEIQNRMKRIRSHELSARRNNVNLTWSSKVETLMFAVISGFQVFTLRRWLLSNTLLGR